MSAPRLFLDSSVLIAAVVSSSGGSFRLCRESNLGNLAIHINQYVLEEITDVICRKYPALVERLSHLLVWAHVNIHENPSTTDVQKATAFIVKKDAPILASALSEEVDFLLTLDRKDFFTKKLGVACVPFIVATPQMFFQQYWIR